MDWKMEDSKRGSQEAHAHVHSTLWCGHCHTAHWAQRGGTEGQALSLLIKPCKKRTAVQTTEH